MCICFSDALISEVENMTREGDETAGVMNVEQPVTRHQSNAHAFFPATRLTRSAAQLLIQVSQHRLTNTLMPSKTLTLTLHFWAKNQDKFPHLHNLAMKVLSVPASSARVERVFSRGGFIMRPHCACLGHRMLQSLMFLKCNQTLL